MKKYVKQNTGITLIALIITIVVLLILAVVTIQAVSGNGIINHAENARNSYQAGIDTEKSKLSYYEGYLEEALAKKEITIQAEYEAKYAAEIEQAALYGNFVGTTFTVTNTSYELSNKNIALPWGTKTLSNSYDTTLEGVENIILPYGFEEISIMSMLPSTLKYMKVPSTVTSIDTVGISTFPVFDVDKNNSSYASVNGVLYNKAKTKLIAYPSSYTSLSLVNSLVEIGQSSFKKTNLSAIKISPNIEKVGSDLSGGFDCTSTKVIFENSTKPIEFAEWCFQSLGDIYIESTDVSNWQVSVGGEFDPGTFDIWSGTLYVRNDAVKQFLINSAGVNGSQISTNYSWVAPE